MPLTRVSRTSHGQLHFLKSLRKIDLRRARIVGRGVPPSRKVGRSPRDRRNNERTLPFSGAVL